MDEQPLFEPVLNRALHRALNLSNTALQLIQSLMPAGSTFATMPHASVYRLHVFATTSYRGALACLRWPETSLSAPILLRALLETWSHIEFIGDDLQEGDARCRALRYERGVLRSWSDIARGHLAWLDMAEWQGQHEEYARGIDALWQEFGCGNAAPRTNKHRLDGALVKCADNFAAFTEAYFSIDYGVTSRDLRNAIEGIYDGRTQYGDGFVEIYREWYVEIESKLRKKAPSGSDDDAVQEAVHDDLL